MEFIRTMWDEMTYKTRKQVVEASATACGVDQKTFKNVYLWGERMPEEKQPIVVEIFDDALAEQEKSSRRVRKAVQI